MALGKLSARLKTLLGVKDTPRRVAVAFAVGVFIGMSPLLGLHTVLALLVAWAFKLNRFVAITGVFITNPWTIIPIYTFSTWVGGVILRAERLMPDIDWGNVTLKGLLADTGHLLWPFVLGTTLVGAVSAAVGYALVKKAVERVQKSNAVKED